MDSRGETVIVRQVDRGGNRTEHNRQTDDYGESNAESVSTHFLAPKEARTQCMASSGNAAVTAQ